MVVIYWLFRDNIDGDPTIYFVFAKNMLTAPLSFGPPDRVAWGATSPIYTFLLSLFHTGNLTATLYAFKIFMLILVFLSIFFMSEIAKVILIRMGRTVSNRRLHFVILTCYLFYTASFYSTVFLFESTLVILHVALLIYLWIRGVFKWIPLVASLSYLTRPELLIVQIPIGLIFAYYYFHRKQYRQLLISSLIFVFPALLYHSYIYYHTDQFLPASVFARYMRYSLAADGLGVSRIVWFALDQYKYTLIFLPACLLAIYAIANRTRQLQQFWLWAVPVPAAALLVILMGSENLPIRYFDFSIPFLIPVISVAIIYFKDDTRVSGPRFNLGILAALTLAGLAVWSWYLDFTAFDHNHNNSITGDQFSMLVQAIPAVFTIAFIVVGFRYLPMRFFMTAIFVLAVSTLSLEFSYGQYPTDSKIANRLDRQFGDSMNAIMSPGERAAIYEIELQYYVDHPLISMDGIVGSGEFLPFVEGEKSLREILMENHINYIGVDPHSLYPRMADSELYRWLYEKDSSIEVNKSVDLEGLRFTKVLEDDGTYEFRMWKSIYRITLLDGGEAVDSEVNTRPLTVATPRPSQFESDYQQIFQILGPTGTITPLINKLDVAAGRTFTSKGAEQLRWEWSKDVSDFDTPPSKFGLIPIVTFNGSNEGASTSDSEYWTRVAGAFSVGVWVNASVGEANGPILGKWGVGTTREWLLNWGDSVNPRPSLFLYDGVASIIVTRNSNADYAANDWFFVVATHDGSNGSTAMTNAAIYINGVAIETTPGDNPSFINMRGSSGSIVIGQDNRGQFFTGSIAAGPMGPFFTQTELTSDQIQDLYLLGLEAMTLN